MTDVRWSKTAPKTPGHYWMRAEFGEDDFVSSFTSEAAKESYDGYEFGPPIPTPELLARLAEFLRECVKRGIDGWSAGEDEARELLSELTKGET